MTTNDLRSYLETYRAQVASMKRFILANERIIKTYEELEPDHITLENVRRSIETSNQRLRNKCEAQQEVVRAWAQLIEDQEHRKIFIDHYINGQTWEDLEEAYHMSHATIYRINKKNIETIAQKTVHDLRPDPVKEIYQAQQ